MGSQAKVIRSQQQQPQQAVQIPIMKQPGPLPSITTIAPPVGQNFGNQVMSQPKQSYSVTQFSNTTAPVTQVTSPVQFNSAPTPPSGVIVTLAQSPPVRPQSYIQQQPTAFQQQQNPQYFAGSQMPSGQMAVGQVPTTTNTFAGQVSPAKQQVLVQGYGTSSGPAGQFIQQPQPKVILSSGGVVQQQPQQQVMQMHAQDAQQQQQQQQQLFKYSNAYGLQK